MSIRRQAIIWTYQCCVSWAQWVIHIGNYPNPTSNSYLWWCQSISSIYRAHIFIIIIIADVDYLWWHEVRPIKEVSIYSKVLGNGVSLAGAVFLMPCVTHLIQGYAHCNNKDTFIRGRCTLPWYSLLAHSLISLFMSKKGISRWDVRNTENTM